MKTQHTYILTVIIVLFSSCGILKKPLKDVDKVDAADIEKLKVKNALDSINSHYPVFETLYSGFTGSYKSKNQELPLKGILKIKTDEFIWISVRPIMGIEIARILITNDSVKIIDKLKNEYIEENLSIVKSKFGFDLNYNIIQSIMLNRFFVFPSDNDINSYFLNNIENLSTLSTTVNFSEKHLSHKTSFSNINFSIFENNLKLLDKHQSLNILYSDFQKLNNKEFPNSLHIELTNLQDSSKINLSYKNIKINEPVKPSFNIPDNYKRVKFD